MFRAMLTNEVFEHFLICRENTADESSSGTLMMEVVIRYIFIASRFHVRDCNRV